MELKYNGMVCFTYVLIVLPLAAISEGPDGLMHVSRPVAHRTLTSAPVLTRNCLQEILSHTKGGYQVLSQIMRMLKS